MTLTSKKVITLLFSSLIIACIFTSCSSKENKESEAFIESEDTIPKIKIKNFQLPVRMHYGDKTRNLNGAGVRKQYFMDIYVAGLYLEEKTNNPQQIINDDKAMSIRLQIISSMLTSEIMEAAIREGLKKSMKEDYDKYKEGIDLICGVFSSEPTKVGDVYDIHYTPGVGISGSKNGNPYSFSTLGEAAQDKIQNSALLSEFLKTLTKSKEGHEALPQMWLKKALMGVWLSDSPVDEQLKDSLLGLENI